MTSKKKNTSLALATQITPSYGYGDTRFRPTHADDLDLRWYFAMGPSEKWKSEDQRRRHRRIARCLSGHGWALRYYYQNPRKLEPAELAPLVEDERIGRGWTELDGLTPDERETFLRRARRSAATTDHWATQGAMLLSMEYSLYVRNQARHYADVDDFVVVSRFALEGLLGVQREHWFDGNRDPFDGRRGREVLVHPGDFIDEMLMRSELHRSTWDDLRVSGTTAQLLVERVGLGSSKERLSKKRALALLKDAAKKAPPPPSRIVTMTPRERATFSYGLPEAAYKAPKFTTDDVRENRRSLTQELREIRKDSLGYLDHWGVADHELRSDLWDPRKLELDPLKETTTVSEIAKRAKLPNQWVRRALVKRGCPGANIKRKPIPVLWFSTEQGKDFWEAVKRERVAVSNYNWKLGKR